MKLTTKLFQTHTASNLDFTPQPKEPLLSPQKGFFNGARPLIAVRRIESQ